MTIKLPCPCYIKTCHTLWDSEKGYESQGEIVPDEKTVYVALEHYYGGTFSHLHSTSVVWYLWVLTPEGHKRVLRLFQPLESVIVPIRP
jgi:hypothetical protein